MMSPMITAPFSPAWRTRAWYCVSVPKAGSISLLMRSKLPSTVGVYSRPRMPPARFIGPVCMPPMPISRKTRQSPGSPRLSSTDSPGPVICEGGYAVNHTEASAEAARGCGTA